MEPSSSRDLDQLSLPLQSFYFKPCSVVGTYDLTYAICECTQMHIRTYIQTHTIVFRYVCTVYTSAADVLLLPIFCESKPYT